MLSSSTLIGVSLISFWLNVIIWVDFEFLLFINLFDVNCGTLRNFIVDSETGSGLGICSTLFKIITNSSNTFLILSSYYYYDSVVIEGRDFNIVTISKAAYYK